MSCKIQIPHQLDPHQNQYVFFPLGEGTKSLAWSAPKTICPPPLRWWDIIINLVMLNKLRCHSHFLLSANQIESGCWYKFTYLLAKSADQDQLASSEVNCQLNWIYTVCIYTVCKSRSYLGAAGPDLYTCIFSSKVATHLATLSVIFCGYSSINFSDNVTTPSRAENKYKYKRRNESIF